MQLNHGQQIAVDGVREDIENDEPGAAIVGEGGTGKTYSTTDLLRGWLAEGKKALMVAPTNKAVKQLEKAARAAGLDLTKIRFSTVHSALGLALMPSSERKHVSRTGESVLPHYDIMVLDEGSMVNSVLLENYIMPDIELLRANGKKLFVLAMGDLMQLPPVKETRSPIFDLFKVYELTQNQRQLTNPDGTDNGILTLCRALRQAIEKNGAFFFNKQPKEPLARHTIFPVVPEHNVFIHNDRSFMDTLLSRFDMNTDLEEVRVIAWRNDRIDWLNNQIRRKIYGSDVAMFELGEQVVTGGPVMDDQRNTILGTDEECRVAAVTESYVFDERANEEWRTICLCLHPIYAEVGQVFVHVVHPEERARYNAKVEAMAKEAKEANDSMRFVKWRRFHEFRDLFNDIRYCYAITAHRAQGSTYKFGFVDVKDMLDNPMREERQRLAYVGLSRFQHEVHLNKMQFML